MRRPLVSVIIPTKGRTIQLITAVESVMKQTYKNIEIIIIDDSDKFAENLFSDKKIRHVWNEVPNNNPGLSRNQGIRLAKGEYIAFLDDDDEWFPSKLEKQINLLDRFPQVKFVICGILDNRYYKPHINTYKESVSHKEILMKLHFSSSSSYLIEAELLRNLGGFDTRLLSAQEYELAIRVSKVSEVRCVSEVLVVQNETAGQISKQWDKKIQGLQMLLTKHFFEYQQLGFLTYIYMRKKFFFVISLYKLAKITGFDAHRIVLLFK